MIQKGLYGLVLSGGNSSRMGKNKANLVYHGMKHQDYLFSLLKNFCEKVFISVKKIPKNESQIADTYAIKSPLNGIVSAIDLFPRMSWLIVGCDLPYIDSIVIEYLLANRDKQKYFTGFYDSDNSLPEPMIGIWEPAAYPKLKSYIKHGKSPREFLTKSPTNLLKVPNPDYLINVNTPEEFERVISRMNGL